MRQFVLIDHSLQDLGGHHYPLAVSILEAAERAGFAPVLATHRQFSRGRALPAHWPVHALFKYPSYSRYALDTQASEQSGRQRRTGLGRLWHAYWWRLQRERISARFARDCRQLFQRLRVAPDDVVFVATASELDLCGLAHFLPTSGLSPDIPWHLQFHFGIFRGRDPQYGTQIEARSAMFDSLQASLRTLQGRTIAFYCTTEPLTRQYQSLALAPFATLAYPVHALFRAPLARHAGDLPARIACLGHARREKRHGLLPELLRELWREFFRKGAAQLVLQTDRAAVRRMLTQLAAALETQQPQPAAGTVSALSFASASLDLENYAQLLRSADIGLLLYDGTRYYDRCSGVLLEMLSSGIPVVVPAASWLSAQIAAVNQRYLADVAAELAAQQRLAPIDGAMPAGCGGLLLEFQWPQDAPPGVYVQLQLRCADTQDRTLDRQTHVLGDIAPGATARLLLRAAAGSVTAVECSAAYGAPPLLLGALKLQAVRGELPPLGAVGLTLADPSLAGAALRDILNHRAHYQRHAAANARDVAQRHDAARLVERLTEAH